MDEYVKIEHVRGREMNENCFKTRPCYIQINTTI